MPPEELLLAVLPEELLAEEALPDELPPDELPPAEVLLPVELVALEVETVPPELDVAPIEVVPELPIDDELDATGREPEQAGPIPRRRIARPRVLAGRVAGPMLMAQR